MALIQKREAYTDTDTKPVEAAQETPEEAAEETMTQVEKLILAMEEKGFKVTIDEDDDPCFIVSEGDFDEKAASGYYADVLKEYGYTASYQVRAKKKKGTAK